MNDIQIYDYEFNLLFQTNKFTSLNWSLKYNDIGTFEGHFSLDTELLPIIMNHTYLIAKQGDLTAIITGNQASGDLAVFGRTCNWILTKRITPKVLQCTETVETLTRMFVENAFVDVNNFVLGEKINLTNKIDFLRDNRTVTFDIVKECLDADEAGHEIIFDIVDKKWVYQVKKGQELPLIMSEANKNAYNTELSGDCLDYFSVGWYEKQPETGITDSESEWLKVSSDITKTGIYCWETILSGKNDSEAKTDLAKKKIRSETVVNSRNIFCGKDYHLGDIVRFQIQKGQYQTTVKQRITGVNIWYEQGNYGERPVFEEL